MEARHAFRQFLRTVAAPPSDVPGAELIFGELAANTPSTAQTSRRLLYVAMALTSFSRCGTPEPGCPRSRLLVGQSRRNCAVAACFLYARSPAA